MFKVSHSHSKLFHNFECELKNSDHPKNIYFGVGVCTRSTLSKGIPFDILSLIFCAEYLRRMAGGTQVFYLIADTHAVLTGHDASEVAAYTYKLSALLENIISTLSLPHECLVSSFVGNIGLIDMDSVQDNQKYMTAQLTDMLYFIKHHGVGYKLGWKYNELVKSQQKLGYDEHHFDIEAKNKSLPMRYCYTQPGFTMDEQTRMVPPYVSVTPKDRVLFCDDRLDEKLGRLLGEEKRDHDLYINFLNEIQILYCKLFPDSVTGLKSFITKMHNTFL